ncbi:MAG: helix-turn-helix domain-containing protein [Actinobacteria bacterium]|nr:helix-turn-helix domain-containing protein [Actinomycetota bacterium]
MGNLRKPQVSSDQLHFRVATPDYDEEPKPVLLTVREAAKLMRIGRDMAYALVAEGSIPSIRLGRHIRIPRASLIAHLHAQAEKAHGEAS